MAEILAKVGGILKVFMLTFSILVGYVAEKKIQSRHSKQIVSIHIPLLLIPFFLKRKITKRKKHRYKKQ